ncbi:hypothetical protein EVAR_100793_1 [Eumeta japonica]|uniref:Uncharacterized protein n=1 Tax=Eumeta variegata TaxID=151549 RepID=A0A4C1SNV2_EUMVA|nr:hypothetical protein EVAR_100793_1 [Eumeta japonica]
MCYTSTGALLSLPPRRGHLPAVLPGARAHQRPEEDHAAHAILDLSQHAVFLATPPRVDPPPPEPPLPAEPPAPAPPAASSSRAPA